ncbi:flagellin [uncultured Pseudoteredinibacter sp.]|uniref:flagellin N-terminal helical domain-containing protein n=1 Tax=uncultured Pseudoteredinibacter sp. TaxID=1641701 RepID=UPI002618218A|nr:flagellin [uncultured Pseudoteredinibacter sp.]
MASVINTNMASLTAQRNLSSAQGAQADAMQRLSSGLRINSAKDDAAGLAISTRFSSQTQGLAVAIRNSGDGVSLAQTAEGALGTMTESLQRVRELALQAANGTNSASDREALNAEAQQMIAEITRTADETNFNGQKLLDGSFDTKFQVGANAGETIDVKVSDVGADTLGVSKQAGVSAVGTDSALGNGDLIINGVEISSSSAADDNASTAGAEASAIAKVAAINKHSDESGVRAVVDENTVAGSTQTAAAQSGTITLNGVDIDIDTTGDAATTRAAVASAINAVSEQTGVKAIDTGDAATGVTLESADGRNIELNLATAGSLDSANTGLAASDTYEGGFTLVAEGDTKEINVQGGNGTGNGDLANAGLSKGDYTPGVSAVASSAKTGTTATSATAATGVIDLSSLFADNSSGTHTVDVDVDGATQTWTFNADLSGAVDNDDLIADLAGNSGVTLTAVNGGAANDGLFTLTSSSTGASSALAVSASAGNGATTAISGYTAGADAGAAADRDLDAGDLVINNVAIKAAQAGDDTASYSDASSSSKEASGISVAAAINKSTGETGVSAEVNATEFVGGSTTSAGTDGNTGAVWVNGVEVDLTVQTDAGSNRAHALEQINKVSGQTGVTATDNGESLTLTAADGRNIVLAFDTNAADNGGVAASNFGLGGTAISSSDITTTGTGKTAADAEALTTYSTVTLSGAGDIEVGAGINGSTALDEIGFTAGSFGGGEDGTFLKDIDLSTVDGANAALTAIDNALDTVNAQRADLGAIQNRFETTVQNLQVNSENLTAANSRIRDADFASETAELSRARVLQQAGTSILAQANALPNQVLSLLQ